MAVGAQKHSHSERIPHTRDSFQSRSPNFYQLCPIYFVFPRNRREKRAHGGASPDQRARRNGQRANGWRGYLGHSSGTASDWQSKKTEPLPLRIIRESSHWRQMDRLSRGLAFASASAVSCRDAGFSLGDGGSVCILGRIPPEGSRISAFWILHCDTTFDFATSVSALWTIFPQARSRTC
jgi:hypothetical protein